MFGEAPEAPPTTTAAITTTSSPSLLPPSLMNRVILLCKSALENYGGGGELEMELCSLLASRDFATLRERTEVAFTSMYELLTLRVDTMCL